MPNMYIWWFYKVFISYQKNEFQLDDWLLETYVLPFNRIIQILQSCKLNILLY